MEKNNSKKIVENMETSSRYLDDSARDSHIHRSFIDDGYIPHKPNKISLSTYLSSLKSGTEMLYKIRDNANEAVLQMSGLMPSHQSINPREEDFFIELTCALFNDEDGIEYSCESTNFTQLQYDQCDMQLNYTYTVTNQFNESILLQRLIDESFQDVIQQSQIINAGSNISITEVGSIDICKGQEHTKQVVAIASLADGSGQSLPFARDTITFETPCVYISFFCLLYINHLTFY